jgi:tetratricopeptide (TPR) repeat protein
MRTWKHRMMRVGLVLVIACVLSAPYESIVFSAGSGQDLFSEGMQAYQNGEYEYCIDRLTQAIPLLQEDTSKIEAYKTLAFAYMAFPRKDEARQQFCHLLKIDPTFELDPIMTPPKILSVFHEARKRCAPSGGLRVEAVSKDQEPVHGAKVYLDGVLIGETPLRKDGLIPGDHELEVKKEGFRSFTSRISIKDMTILSVKRTLVRAHAPTIFTISHNVTGPLLPDDRIEVTLKGDAGRTATFDLGDVTKDVPMHESVPGIYVGGYRVTKDDRFQDVFIIGHLQDEYGGRTAIQTTKPVSTSQISRSQLLYRRGQTSMEQGDYELAIDSLTKALYEDPSFVDAHILLAEAYNRKQGAYLESVKYLKNAIELDGDNLKAHRLLAKIYLENGRHESALPVVERVLEIAPDSGFAYGYLGEILYSNGKYEEAIKTLRTSLLLAPGNPRIYFLLGDAFVRLDRLADAVFEFETAVALSPTSYLYRDALATCHKALEQDMGAAWHWEQCLKMADMTEYERKKVTRKLSELRR